MVPPLIFAFVLDSFSIRSILLTISILLCIGQLFFAIGLADKDQWLCVLGRFFVGFSDALAIPQQIIMCIWFPASHLPLAFGILLFFQKVVRTTNDNVASIFYEATSGGVEEGEIAVHSLVMYQWIGFAVCVLSVFCSILLV